jgi:hypothetical protein
MEKDMENGQQTLEPVLQEEVAFKDHTITAVKLADGRYAVVLRWVCEVLNLDPSGQVRRIQRTAAIAGELLRVKVQPRPGAEKPKRGGGAQVMPVLTLRGFSPWILGINPGEVAEDPAHPEQAARIREMIIAYQQEAIDVLYTHFMRKTAEREVTTALLEARTVVIPSEPLVKPQEPEAGADDQTFTTYYEDLAVWAMWKASQHAQQWRGQMQAQLESLQIQMEHEKAVTDLIPDVLAQLGQQKISKQQQANIRGMVQRLSELSGVHWQTIYWELSQAFQVPRYDELLEHQYPSVCEWFKRRMDAAKGNRR